MRILVLDEEFPYPLNTGKRLRSFNLYSRLSEKVEVIYLAYGSEHSEAYQYFKNRNLNPVNVDYKLQKKQGVLFYLKLIANIFHIYPYIVTSHYSKTYISKVQNIVRERKPDCIIAEWTPYALYLKDINVPVKIISTHNIESEIWRRYCINENNFLKRFYIQIQYLKVLSFEKKCVHWCQGAIAVSTLEAKTLKNYSQNLKVEVVDNGVDLDYFDNKETYVPSHKIVFTGSMDWRPNQDAIVYFHSEIYPVIKKQLPDLKFYVVGRNPSDEIKKLNSDDFIITGTVDDVRPYIQSAGVYVVPLRIGGGSRLKILEAMSMKKPVVSTYVGAEGLEVTNEVNILLADNIDDFVSHINTVFGDESTAANLGENGRNLVEQRYGWNTLAAKYLEFLDSFIE